MSWTRLRVDSFGNRWSELDLPADQIAADLAQQEQIFAVAAASRRASIDLPRCRSLETPALLRVRRDQATLTDAERQAFKNAVKVLVDEGTYDRLVRLRGDAAHNMFGSLGVAGLHRFLPWHRRYLWQFETELQRADRRLRPDEMPLGLPYWNWPDPFPDWLIGFLPAAEPAARSTAGDARRGDRFAGSASTGRSSRVDRSHDNRSPVPPALAGSGLKPTHDDMRLILHGFSAHLPDAQVSDYVKFTYGLEGWGQRPDGTRLPAHNQVHCWVGGAMERIGTSPTDPICWLHLAQVDRLWSLWQAEHPGCGPALLAADQILDPWPETADDVASPLELGYAYDP
ncbi:MAG TPA: tyrosinase family protein [Pirellulales bacterium]|jgi:tyrosinase|nr:tyrosinase family protein [Pirellulales bacterium]